MQEQTRNQNQTTSPDWAAWAKAWGGVVVIAFLNGVLHRAYEGALGELRSHQLSSFVLLALLAPWAIRTERRHRIPSLRAALGVGLMWASASAAFEFVFGHYVNKDSWAELLRAYNLLDGRLWLVDVVGIAAAPALARGWRIRRQRGAESLGYRMPGCSACMGSGPAYER